MRCSPAGSARRRSHRGAGARRASCTSSTRAASPPRPRPSPASRSAGRCASAQQVYVAGCAVNLNPAQFGDIDQRVTPFVGTADDVAARHGRPGRPELRRPRARRPGPRAARAATAPRPRARVASSRSRTAATATAPTASSPRSAAPRARARRARSCRGRRARAQRPARDGDDRDQRRRLPRPRAGARAGRADDGGGPRARRAAGPALQRRGDPRQGHAAEALATEPKVCPHLHVPMQSGDDDVLARWAATTAAAEYLEHIAPRARRGGAAGQSTSPPT